MCHEQNYMSVLQRRTFTFGALGYFELEAHLEGLRRLMSYKLTLNVLHSQNKYSNSETYCFILNSLDIRKQKQSK